MDIKPILEQSFYHDGRGPELQRVYCGLRGATLTAIDYFNPDDEYIADNLKHLLFLQTQVFMFTPEEVYNYESGISWILYDHSSIVCLGKSAWLKSFSPRHLAKCLHYQVMFYDEYLDVICEEIIAKSGGFTN